MICRNYPVPTTENEGEHDTSPASNASRTASPRGIIENRILGGLFILGLMYTLYFVRKLLFPILTALLLFMRLEPLVRFLQRWKVPQALAAALVLVLLVTLSGRAFYRLASPAMDWFNRGP